MKVTSMTFNRWHRCFSLISSDDVALNLVPLSFVFGLLSFLIGGWFVWPIGVIALYVLLAYVANKYYQRHSRLMGLQYYYVVPIHPILAKLFVRKITLRNKEIYKLHVNHGYLKKYVRSMKESLRGMESDISKLEEYHWGEDPVFIGNTFADLGTRNREMINRYAEICEYEGTFHPVLRWTVSPLTLIKEQKKIFGKVYSVNDNIRWRIFILWPKGRK